MPAKDLSGGKNYYHIYNSGVENRDIFTDAQDRQVFESYLGDYLSPANPELSKKVFTVHGKSFTGTPHQPKNYYGRVELVAYSLMPSHFHLVLRQKADRSVESLLRSLCTRYSMYFNKKYSRSGSLFSGPYKSAVIGERSLLGPLVHFIHHGANSWSSYPEYSGKRDTPWVNTTLIQSGGKLDTSLSKKDLPKEIILENETQTLERRDLSESNVNFPNPSKSPKTQKPFAEITALGAVFLILLGLGLKNIEVTRAKDVSQSPGSTDSSAVLSESTSLEESAPKVEGAKTESAPKTLVVIKVPDADGSTFIRSGPNTESEILLEAKNDEEFELTGVDTGWYKVKLASRETGYIFADYAYLQQTDN